MVTSPIIAIFFLISVGTLCAHGDHETGHQSINETEKKFPECGSTNPNGNFVDQTEPEKPGPFHDLTSQELKKLRDYLEKDPQIRADKSSYAKINSSYIFTAELLMPLKEEALQYLDKSGFQPPRVAHVIMFRGDKSPPVVEEWYCGPLPEITKCELLNCPTRRNPVEFNIRPLNGLEIKAMKEVFLKKVDEKVGDVLKESYGSKFTDCLDKDDCLASSISPVGSGIVKSLSKRLMWVNAMYKLPYPTLHVLDFSVLVNSNDTDPTKWTVEKVWYSDKVFESLEDLESQYKSGNIKKTRVTKPKNDENLFSNLRRRGEFQPAKPQRQPVLVEPDGKRYTIKERKVDYLGWTFNYHLSPTTGPAVFDVRYKGERIIYELSLSDIARFYSGSAPFVQTLNEMEHSMMLGSRSKALIPGADCPETATMIKSVFMSQYSEEPAVYDNTMCLFENVDGHAMRRHLAYSAEEGGFYGGMMDTQLILRTVMTVQNHDYIMDILFHQNGVIHTRFMASGYLQTTFMTSAEKPYGHQIQEHILGNINHNMFHLKVDLDIHGTSNRYETLGLIKENFKLTALPDAPYSQIKINTTLRRTEKEAVNDFDYSSPKQHIIHNNEKRNKFNEAKAYRVEVRDRSINLIEEGLGNEDSIAWARHQVVVTKRKHHEGFSSSIYSMFDSYKPVYNYTSYYEDNENIVDEDLVFWVTAGIHNIPHSEDIPNTPALPNQLNIFMLPHNYFPECPSIGSRDAIYIEYKDPKDPSKGVKVDRNGNSRDQCVIPKSTLEEDFEENPDRILESKRRNPTDF